MAILTLPSNPEFNDISREYYDDLAVLASRALAGSITQAVYASEQEQLTEAAMMAVLLLSEADLTNAEVTAILEAQLAQANKSAGSLAVDVAGGRYLDKEGSLLERLELWTYSLGYLFGRGRLYAGEDEDEMEWRLGRTEQHCPTCLSQAGQTRTRAGWRALANQGITPQGSGLACGGWRCDCSQEEV